MARETESKRKYPRKSFRKAVSYICDGRAGMAHALEIGEGGMSFTSDHKIELNKKMILSFFLSDKDFFSVRVTLLNSLAASRSFTYGVSFDNVSIALKRQIRTYVARTSL